MMWIERVSNKSVSFQDDDKSMNGEKYSLKRERTMHFVTVAVSMLPHVIDLSLLNVVCCLL